MSFVSLEFIGFLILTITLYYTFPKKFRFIVLLIANTVFYIISCKAYSLALFSSILIVYFSALLIGRCKTKTKKKLIFISSILLNLGMLIFFKEHNNIIGTINKLFSKDIKLLNIAMPLGISYYTLVALSYIIDVYLGRQKAVKNFFKIYLSMTFFPLMLEGPIVKVSEVADSLYEGQKFDYNNLKYGYLRILLGYTKKLVIADRVGILVDNVFNTGYVGTINLTAMIFYVIQIYTEFSGCMDIVIGIGRIFNVNLPENFKEPLFSKNINEFWRRWHITLGRWLKDYIFFPITMSKLNMKINMKTHKKLPRFLADTLTSIIPLFFVWSIMGFWHGYGIKYFVYGMYYFVIIILGMLFKPIFDKIITKLKINTKCSSYKLFQMIRTFFFVTIGMGLFRAKSLGSFASMIKGIYKEPKCDINTLIGGTQNLQIAVATFLFIFIIDILKYRGFNIEKWLEEQNLVFRYIVFLVALFFVLIFGMYGYGYNPASFIYGDF